MRRLARVAPVAAVLVLMAGLGGPANAQPVTQVVTGEHLRLVSVTSADMAGMSPGETATWDVGVGVTTPGEAEVAVSLEVLDATPGAFQATVTRCPQRFAAAGCPTRAEELTTAALVTGESAPVDRTDADHHPWYRIAVTFVGATDGAVATLQVLAVGEGDEVSAGGGTGPGEGGLPATGAQPWSGLLFAGAAIAGGIGLAGLAGRHRHDTQRR